MLFSHVYKKIYIKLIHIYYLYNSIFFFFFSSSQFCKLKTSEKTEKDKREKYNREMKTRIEIAVNHIDYN